MQPWFKFLTWLAVAVSVDAHAERYEIPYMPRGDDLEHQGFMRITNLSTATASVDVFGVGDDGQPSFLAQFSLTGGETKGYRITELENGIPSKGLTGSIGTGVGDWRIVYESISPLRVVGFYRNPTTGFLNSLHDTAPAETATTHILPTVNPGSNPNQLGMVRLMNPLGVPATAFIYGTDDQGIEFPATGFVEVDLVPFGAITVSVAELEQGSSNPAIRNVMGDGSGKWRLTVSSSSEIGVMSLIFSPDGYLSNITSTSKYRVGDNGSPLTCGSIDRGILMGDSVEPTYLGFFGDAFASDSIFNTFGNFGSAFSSTSIFNDFSDWGSPFSAESAFNEFASRPPIIQKNGQFVAFLTTNSTKSPRVDPNAVISTCTFFGSSRSSLHP